MSQPRNRWLVRIILALAVTAFLGVSVIPIISAINNPSPSNQNAASTSSVPSDQISKLQDEVRGYQMVLQREPENQTALNGLLQARLQLLSLRQGDIQGVIEPLEKLAQLNPEQSEYGVLLAQAKQQMGDLEGSAQAYRSILDTKPGDLKALQGMVALLVDQQRPEAAIGLLEDTLSNAEPANKIQPGSVDTVAIQVLLGTVHASQKRYPEATSVYDQAIKKDPQDFRPVLAKAMLFREQGKVEEAKPLFDSAVALAPAQYKDEINRAAASPSPAPPETSETPAEE
ncbi:MULTISPECIES: tetratricopeptide repeat protein [Cyanophyceae]|uniref:tetratricopeptide repeat protein n=2 Tax=Cyanobacteriota TaxID=1117 RepID=UPI00232FAEA5|nr:MULTISPECIES: tetratricopeptide repeat protein [Cyanophyceae]MDB9342994.1 tetratricopeptide repeat protein [Nodularia spumigena CS-588/06]MDB9369683.1 tetratricopeptide repeat protein [Nodularia spumigena CS-586/05]MDB9400184.1 tetratricopeptide repeat protein [Microcystis aeruginosa CS-567/02-A1]MDB9498959.1 tetratricopeptide repeat protein [Nodularia spumigena CS-336/02]MDB9532501.1 tetratricopeptide repeat protein [Nodularia spumigena CS-1038]